MIRLRAYCGGKSGGIKPSGVLMKSTIFGDIALYHDDVGIRINILLRTLYLMS